MERSFVPPNIFNNIEDEFRDEFRMANIRLDGGFMDVAMNDSSALSQGSSTPSEVSTMDVTDTDDNLMNGPSEAVDATDRKEKMDLDPSPRPVSYDLADSIKGMYRILDLITEQGSGGLVDKIIIAQDSLRAFINAVCPGAYVSMTKVNFKALDQHAVKPVGIYGSKEEIVRFLSSCGMIDDEIAARLLVDDPDHSKPTLRSGLYIVRTERDAGLAEQLFLIYWPEEKTWDDSATSSVCRNRVAFMRYLTKICDQVNALISPEHAQDLVWSTQGDEDDGFIEIDQEESDRMFTFEVAKTNEQEESVTIRSGFTAKSDHIANIEPPLDSNIDPALLKPRLLYGEMKQGFMTISYHAGSTVADVFDSREISRVALRDHLLSDTLHLNENLDDDALQLLNTLALATRFPSEIRNWEAESVVCRERVDTLLATRIMDYSEKLNGEVGRLSRDLHGVIVDAILDHFPTLHRESFPYGICDDTTNHGDGDFDEEEDVVPAHLESVTARYPRVGEALQKYLHKSGLDSIPTPEFQNKKQRICLIEYLLNHLDDWNEQQRTDLVNLVLSKEVHELKRALKSLAKEVRSEGRDPVPQDKTKGTVWSVVAAMASFVPSPADTQSFENIFKKAVDYASHVKDPMFVTQLEDYAQRLPALARIVATTKDAIQSYFDSIVKRACRKWTDNAVRIQQEEYSTQLTGMAANAQNQAQQWLKARLINQLNHISHNSNAKHTLRLQDIQERKPFYYSRSTALFVTGSRERLQDPMLTCTVHLLQLTAQDKHSLQVDPSSKLSPKFTPQPWFRIPVGFNIIRAQLLDDERLLLVLTDRSGNIQIYLERILAMDGAIGRDGHGKSLHRDKIGHNFLVAFDESKLLLSIVASDKLHLYNFAYDQTRGFQGTGSAINLTQWYSEGTAIQHACFLSGSEELLLVDSHAQARIFSLTTVQFRPASLDLRHIPTRVHSSPDGSCFLISRRCNDPTDHLVAYHWSTFGSTDGTDLGISGLSIDDAFILTSLVYRSTVHLLRLDIDSRSCNSVALDIKRKVTEFMFKEKGAREQRTDNAHISAHNCLIDCHADIWTRFPVLPAVQRQTISSLSNRLARTLFFVTDRDHALFAPHFNDMIQTFERTTKKPTGDILKSMRVSAMTFDAFAHELRCHGEWNISRIRAGEWLVDFLCLIPIHIAITKENRFVPLKDGVYSAEMEKSLLGADVNRIVDSISFGWYESIFQSYMAFKPVKVVSSMGEQSVGKSFALNHLVDTSFAGSAMRTTEGVWMSVSPTQESLIVALDFEGVHSIERSAQEDTLLVLFNTALSNLVLFRNNFALSRDITGLFQSFQSSSTVLDPAANPNLFQSRLAIIIKDVVDSDKAEIAKEFRLKFQKIVQDEQEANFISRLHAGNLDIIPWPVIESKEFYKLFPILKRRLDQQVVTHNAAGQFLHVVKTLMAKLKANDWGALSQTMASHRVQVLLSLLPTALSYGCQELDPQPEPLKNLDTDVPVEKPDTAACLPLGTGASEDVHSRAKALSALCNSWSQYPARQLVEEGKWAIELAEYLNSLVTMRIDHVREWIAENISRFQTGHASIEDLKRIFENATVDLRRNLQLCMLQCASCQLNCVQGRIHNGPHDCQTTHQCIHMCDFCEEELKGCTMTAGHPGRHICIVNAHLCGKQCKDYGKKGCLEQCTKVIDHLDEDHQCAATVHACGKPCDLKGLALFDGTHYACPDTCRIPSDIEHDLHKCDARMCSISCQLCKRLCSNQDHLHGLKARAIHLCGQEHSCSSDCMAPGICEIGTSPHSIEATFTGRHETFLYTKYSQLANRLKCAKPIPPGFTKHIGPHTHSLDNKVVHFCEARCENCGYFCTLPLGHPQHEHETRHGSMSQSRWVIDGPDGTGLEVEGRRFASNDDGAPMMCNIVCQALGRHVHIDYCRSADPAVCSGNEVQHIATRILPYPDRPKDYLTHGLHWRRSGFKDPYSREEQANFTKCDAMCSGPEHTAATGNAAQSSYCMLPLFHKSLNPNTTPAGLGYISNDGHQFSCKNPIVMQQAFHVVTRIFVIDRSGSMGNSDRGPLPDTPVSDKIRCRSNNRLGAIQSSLYSFWAARAAATAGNQQAARRDAYSVVLFCENSLTALANDFTSSPDQLLDVAMRYSSGGGTNFKSALEEAARTMEKNWSTERTPVIIFLSDGECSVADVVVRDVCRKAMQLGKALSFHAVSFGPDSYSSSLRRMAQIAREIQDSAPPDPLAPTAALVKSSYTQALDTVQLAETFLGIAESLRKPRGALLH